MVVAWKLAYLLSAKHNDYEKDIQKIYQRLFETNKAAKRKNTEIKIF